VAILFAAMARAEDKPTCTAGIFGAGQVQAVPDGRTVRLSDGRTVRLAGIEVSQPDEADSRANNAKLALEHLVFNRPITLMRLGPETDRHGRVVALVALPSLHPARLSSTRCWRRARPGGGQHRGFRLCRQPVSRGKTCAHRGPWPLGQPVLCDAKCRGPAGVLAVRGPFAVVEGKVLSVRESGGTICVNFGRR
jgi:hypothetical protein